MYILLCIIRILEQKNIMYIALNMYTYIFIITYYYILLIINYIDC